MTGANESAVALAPEVDESADVTGEIVDNSKSIIQKSTISAYCPPAQSPYNSTSSHFLSPIMCHR